MSLSVMQSQRRLPVMGKSAFIVGMMKKKKKSPYLAAVHIASAIKLDIFLFPLTNFQKGHMISFREKS